MSKKMTSLLLLGLMPLLLGLSTPLSFAPTPRYSIVISNAPGVPQDIWVGANSVSGTWKGGGSICLTGGVINAIAKVLGVPLPPDFDSSMVQMIVVFKAPMNGGFGSPPLPLTDDNFFIEAAFEFTVIHGVEEFEPELAAVLPFITKGMLTFDYSAGRDIQPVMAWMYLNLPPEMGGPMWVPADPTEFPRMLMTVITIP